MSCELRTPWRVICRECVANGSEGENTSGISKVHMIEKIIGAGSDVYIYGVRSKYISLHTPHVVDKRPLSIAA